MDTILEVVRRFREVDPAMHYLQPGEDVAVGKFQEFEISNWNGKVRTVPTEALNLPGRANARSYQYRGQAIHYPTCGPSLLRGVPNDEWQIKARLVLERFRTAELELLLREHPFQRVAERRGFWIDYHALAQHYGIPTSLLDLTTNVEIAAFFAVAKWDGASGRFTPMEAGVGVMFRFDWSAFGSGYSNFFDPVGFGPGLRPARQHAWTFRLRPGVDFHDVPHVEVIEFKHNKSESEKLFEMFRNGDWLYPPDCLASLVERLRDLPFLTMNAIRYAAKQDGQPDDKIEASADRAAHFLSDVLKLEILDGYELQPEEEDLAIASQQASQLEAALAELPIGLRLVRRRTE